MYRRKITEPQGLAKKYPPLRMPRRTRPYFRRLGVPVNRGNRNTGRGYINNIFMGEEVEGTTFLAYIKKKHYLCTAKQVWQNGFFIYNRPPFVRFL